MQEISRKIHNLLTNSYHSKWCNIACEEIRDIKSGPL